MKELIKHIVQALVDYPEQIAISEVEGKQSTVLEIKVAKEDIGKIIGKHGRTAQAINENDQVTFDIEQGEKGPAAVNVTVA